MQTAEVVISFPIGKRGVNKAELVRVLAEVLEDALSESPIGEPTPAEKLRIEDTVPVVTCGEYAAEFTL